MTTTGYLGWDPYTIVAMIGGRYVGTVNTGIENKFVEKEVQTGIKTDLYIEVLSGIDEDMEVLAGGGSK